MQVSTPVTTFAPSSFEKIPQPDISIIEEASPCGMLDEMFDNIRRRPVIARIVCIVIPVLIQLAITLLYYAIVPANHRYRWLPPLPLHD